MKVSNVLWGVVLVGIGLILGLNMMEVTDINVFFDGWWTLFIIIPSFINLFKNGSKTANITCLIIGIALFLGCRDILDFSKMWKLIVPFIIVMIGLSIIFKDAFSGKIVSKMKKLNTGDLTEYAATFSAQNLNFAKEKFTGCELNAIFGSVKCDLREAVIKEDVYIESYAVFGGIEILAPKDVNVKISSTPIFGGSSDRRDNTKNDGKHTIYIKSVCMFGGLEVK